MRELPNKNLATLEEIDRALDKKQEIFSLLKNAALGSMDYVNQCRHCKDIKIDVSKLRNVLLSRKRNYQKAAPIGIVTLRNEEECIRGWAKTMLYFAEEVYALIDPDTTDNMENILRSEFKTIKIIKQDRSLGDSDNAIEGDKKALIMHANYNHFINELVDKNEWWFFLSADERFFPGQFLLIEQELKFCKKHGAYQAWYVPGKRMYQFYPDDFHVLNFNQHVLRQYKFIKKVKDYKHGLVPHSGWNFMDYYPFKSKASWFHYCFIKITRPAFGFWRDVKRFKDYPTLQYNNPMPQWRTMPELNNRGEFIK